MSFWFPPYSDEELDQIFGSLPLLARPAAELREGLRWCAAEYQRQRLAFDDYYARHTKDRELLRKIEAIERVLEMPFLNEMAGRRWKAAKVSELLQSAEKMGGSGVWDDENLLCGKPPLAELSRRTLKSIQTTLVAALKHTHRIAVTGPHARRQCRNPRPGRNDKWPSGNS